MAQNRFKKYQYSKYESDNQNREEEHFKLIIKTTDDLGLSNKYVDSLVKIEKFYIKLLKAIFYLLCIVFPIILLLVSVYKSYDTCNGLFGESVNVFLSHHRHYNKFKFIYEKYYEPKSDVDFHKYPWMVRIICIYDNKPHFCCSGFLITDRDILTAAHCFVYESRREIYLGGTTSNDFNDSIIITNNQFKIFNHPKFKYQKIQHDIALIKLNKPVQFSKTIHPIRLPLEISTIPKNLTLTGWINTEHSIYNPLLKEEVIPIFDVDYCTKEANRTFKDKIVIASFETKSIPLQFCGGFEDTYITPGDSGMPIQLMNDVEPVAYGIISSGPKLGVKKPQIFTNIFPYLHWILCNAGDEFCTIPKK